ncbi:MAG: hypothetical protein ACXW4Z_23015 [Candidatus Binatia bacterium]
MLRYALAVALTPDHGIQFFDTLPQSSALADVDAVIVDAATLRVAEKPPLVDFKAIQRWQVPTVWIDDRELSASPARANWVNLKPPVQREQLHKALFECLNPPAGAPPAARKIEPRAAAPIKARGQKSEKSAAAPPAAADNVIELVDVVEDEEGTN